MAGPGGASAGFNFSSDLLGALPDINSAAKQASANVKAIQKEIDQVIKKGQQATKEQLAALKAAQQVEAKIKLLKRQQATEGTRGFAAGARSIASAKGQFGDARGTLDLLRGDFSLGNVRDAVEIGADAARAAKASKVAGLLDKAAAGLAAVSAAAIYVKFAYDLVNDALEAANDNIKAIDQSQKAFKQTFRDLTGDAENRAYMNIKKMFQRYEGGQAPGSDGAIFQEKELQKYAADADKLLSNSGQALYHLRRKAQADLERAGLDMDGIRGKYGLAAQLSSDKGNIVDRWMIIREVMKEVEAQRQREADQKRREEQIREQDPSYGVRMRNRDTYLKGVERDRLMAYQEWNDY